MHLNPLIPSTMHGRYAALFTFTLALGTLEAQVLVSDSLLVSHSMQELMGMGVGNAQNGIEIHKLVYNTIDPFGEPTIASGALVLPITGACYHPLAAYMHGTILHREEVPSRLSDEIVVGYFLGGTGYVTVLPDYLGLGDSPGPHPYIHSASEASASIDMLRAAREFCAARNMQLNNQLFLIGYSQGGHACMATHKAIQDEHADEFTVTASAPCSGPYDVSGVQAAVMVSPDPYPAPYYLPYVILSFGYVYPGIYSDIGDIFKEPYATILPPLFEGDNGSGVVDAVMPEVPSQILHDSILQAFATEPDHYFRVALRDNDLYDWKPEAPVRMMYCESDSHVFYRNSIVARDAMVDNGATAIQALSAGAGLDHQDCAFPALLASKNWFDTQRTPCDYNGIDERPAIVWSAHPNPARDRIRLTASDGMGHALNWALHAADGRMLTEGKLAVVHGEGSLELPGASSGMYVLHLQGDAGSSAVRVVLE